MNVIIDSCTFVVNMYLKSIKIFIQDKLQYKLKGDYVIFHVKLLLESKPNTNSSQTAKRTCFDWI